MANKDKITTVRAQMHRSKEKLNYTTGRRDFPALVSTAQADFGSWGKALYAAGIDPIFILFIIGGANRERRRCGHDDRR
jgi:hypothetical protein